MKEDSDCCGFTLLFVFGYGLWNFILSSYLIALTIENRFEFIWQKLTVIVYLMTVALPGFVSFICLALNNYSLIWRTNLKQLTQFAALVTVPSGVYVFYNLPSADSCFFNKQPFAFERMLDDSQRMKLEDECLLQGMIQMFTCIIGFGILLFM
jgi:hypothetical protein